MASHPGPTIAVTTLTALLAVSAGHTLGTGALVTGAVLSGQLSIGWSNDLLDAERDREVGRADKPIAGGTVSAHVVRVATSLALLACIGLSLACGLPSAAVHLLLGVAWGWAYNAWFKHTLASPLPYAIAFGSLPAVVTLALPERDWPAVWMLATGALLGVGAHLLNALPDLDDDEATGVRALPHRLGARTVRWLAPLVLLLGSVVALLAPGATPAAWLALGGCVALAAVAVAARGRWPFVAAIGIAAVDVVSLVIRS
jgi:4-hydroxybenzoate polyprenyltransferase